MRIQSVLAADETIQPPKNPKTVNRLNRRREERYMAGHDIITEKRHLRNTQHKIILRDTGMYKNHPLHQPTHQASLYSPPQPHSA